MMTNFFACDKSHPHHVRCACCGQSSLALHYTFPHSWDVLLSLLIFVDTRTSTALNVLQWQEIRWLSASNHSGINDIFMLVYSKILIPIAAPDTGLGWYCSVTRYRFYWIGAGDSPYYMVTLLLAQLEFINAKDQQEMMWIQCLT